MSSIKVGVIGVGYLGNFHAQNYKAIKSCTLTGVYDLDPGRAAQVAKKHKTAAYNSPEALLADCDAVSIAVPTTGHFEIAKMALEAGGHVLVEKPVTVTLKEADALVDLAAQKNLALQVGHIERFNPAVQALAGVNITPRFIESHRLAPFNPRGTDVAVILDLMIHDIDLALHFTGSPVVSAEAVGVPVTSASEDIANARLVFTSGCVANITASRISLSKMRKMRIFQENAYLSMDFVKGETEVFQLDAGDGAPLFPGKKVMDLDGAGKKGAILRSAFKGKTDNPLRRELEAFVQAVTDGTPPPVTGTDGRNALAVALSISEKIKSK